MSRCKPTFLVDVSSHGLFLSTGRTDNKGQTGGHTHISPHTVPPNHEMTEYQTPQNTNPLFSLTPTRPFFPLPTGPKTLES